MLEYESQIRRQLAHERVERIAAEVRQARRHGSSRGQRARRRIQLAGVLGSLRRWSLDRAPALHN
jgi:hypothetical protein